MPGLLSVAGALDGQWSHESLLGLLEKSSKFTEAADSTVFGAVTAIDENGTQPGLTGAFDVVDEVIAHHQDFFRPAASDGDERFEKRPSRFATADF